MCKKSIVALIVSMLFAFGTAPVFSQESQPKPGLDLFHGEDSKSEKPLSSLDSIEKKLQTRSVSLDEESDNIAFFRDMKNPSTWPGGFVLNIIGGIAASFAFGVIVWVYNTTKAYLKLRKFRKIFGSDVEKNGISLVYSRFVLRNPDSAFPYTKASMRKSQLSTQFPVPSCDLSVTNYLSALFGRILKVPAKIVADEDIIESLNLSMISFGIGANLKSLDCFTNPGNHLVRTSDPHSLVLKADTSPLFAPEPGYDYGVILKIHPLQFPSKTWIACAGRNVWGTSASAWYLANKWEEIIGMIDQNGVKIGRRPFAVVIRVRPGQDESVEVVRIIA